VIKIETIYRLLFKEFIIYSIEQRGLDYIIITDKNEKYRVNNIFLNKELEKIKTQYIDKGYAVKVRLEAKNHRVYFTIPKE
jgi:hypothetical protein